MGKTGKTYDDLSDRLKADIDSSRERVRGSTDKLLLAVGEASRELGLPRLDEVYTYMGIEQPEYEAPSGGLAPVECEILMGQVRDVLEATLHKLARYEETNGFAPDVLAEHRSLIDGVYEFMEEAYDTWTGQIAREYSPFLSAIEEICGTEIDRIEPYDLPAREAFLVSVATYEGVQVLGCIAKDASIMKSKGEMKGVKKELNRFRKKLEKWKRDAESGGIGVTLTSALDAVEQYVAGKEI